MNTENWKNVKEILQEVLPLDVKERQIFLDNSAISPEVRREIESLLSFEEEAENLMNLPAVEFSQQFFDGEDEASNALIGQQIGVYRVVRELGYGGMGAVYLAERTDGKFQQKVALKLLKREMNTAALRRRFQQEQTILASLEHPHIARLLDAGTTGDKIPFLAMEYVEGLPVDEYCAAHELDLNQRLDLFRKICAAVGFAHRNLVVHRDLKPSNIMVNEDGVPKLLDFGISKILSAEFEQTDAATVTKLGAMTPGYASPEQLQNKSVTTATDIYSLGVILYELLSGHRPFEKQESDIKQIYQAVLENEPPPPSAAISDFGFQVSDSKKQFETPISLKSAGESEAVTEFNKLEIVTKSEKSHRTNSKSKIQNPKSISLDLDNIVLKALRKEPERRYMSAENFAEDIHRYQRGLPVTARPNTFAYRAEKFIRRNRAAAIAAALILCAVITGVAATLWQAKVARNERTKAETAQLKAEKRFGDVRKLANSYLFDVFPEIEDLEGSLKARQIIVKTALEYLDSLSRESGGDQDLQLEMATGYEKIGDVQGAVSITNLGDIKAALESYEKARTLREAVFETNPDDLKNKEALSKNYQITAQTLQWNIDTAKAAEYFEKAIKLRRELVGAKPDSPDYQNRLAVMLTDYAGIPIENSENEKALKLLDEAAAIIKQTLEKNPDHFYTRKSYPRLLRAYAHLKTNAGDYEGAIKNLDEAVILTNQMIKEKSDDYSLNRTAFVNDFGYCEVYVAERSGKKSVESCLKTVDFNVKALEKEPGESFALYDLAMTDLDIAQGYRFSNDPKNAAEYAEKALKPLAELDNLSPGVNEYMRSIAVVENELALAVLSNGDAEKALEYLRDAQIKMEKVVENDPTVMSYHKELADIYRSAAAACHKKADDAKAVEYADRAMAIVTQLNASKSLREADKNLLTELEKEKSEYIK